MADEKTKPALSLNQLHKRFLVDLSASQSRPKPVNFESTMTNDDLPKFNFGTPSPPPPAQEAKLDESVSKIKDPSPHLSAGLEDFDSDLECLDEDGKTSEGGNASEINSAIRESLENNPDYAGAKIAEEERQTKVRLEGRRRLCKISYNNDGDEGNGASSIIKEKPILDDLPDFDSPPQVKMGGEDSGNEIRDILNDLSSRFDILSIEKPKRTAFREDVKDPVRSKLYDVGTEKQFTDQKVKASSLLSPDFPANSTIGSKSGVTANNEFHVDKASNIEVKTDSHISKANRTMDYHANPSKNEAAKACPKSGFAKESQAYNFLTRMHDTDANNRASLGETRSVKQVDRRQNQNFVEISDDESDSVTAPGDHGDVFSLSGPKGTYKLSAKIATMLFPHQREGLKWLWSLHCKGKGGILGDDMGLGKTMQICGFLAGLFSSKLIRRVLVVAPTTLLRHWENELSTVGLSRLIREYYGANINHRHSELQYVLQDKGILLTTYDIVRINANSLCGDYRYHDDGEDENIWDYIFLDEGHIIKNPNTQRSQSLLQIPCRHRVIISGTPLQNNLKELWALFNFCCPGLLGDKNEFKQKYEYFINRGNEKNASDREKRIGSSVAKNLRDCIQPYFLRRLKSEVFGDNTLLSKKNEIIIWLPLTRCQRELYEAFLKSEIVVSACDGSPLAAITILKKICDHPLLLTKRAAKEVLEGMDSTVNKEDHHVAEKLAMHIADVAERFDIIENNDLSCKLSFISSLLGELIPKGHNVLIFSQSRKMLDLIQETLVAQCYRFLRIDGTTKANDRAKTVKDFQDGRAPIFLLTSQVGGLGLTLTNADRVIVVDPAWNPSTDNQSVDRAYRIGQKKDVIVYRLMTCSTVEEKIYRKQVFKGGLFRSATEHKEQTRYFSQQDLRDLFSLPQQGFDISLTQQQLLEEHDRQHTMEESLRAHVEFLETLNIAGVSHHSLLFSKTAPVQTLELDEENERLKGHTSVRNAYTNRSVEREVDGAEFAFNPKDAKKIQKSTHTDFLEPTEDEIRYKINRFHQTYMQKAAMLPDKGLKLQKQIAALNQQLDQLRLAKGKEAEVIEL